MSNAEPAVVSTRWTAQWKELYRGGHHDGVVYGVCGVCGDVSA